MKIHRIVLVLPIIVVLCINMSSPEVRVAGGDKPNINIKGKIEDTTGEVYEVENITISGLYRQIQMYKKPNKLTKSPFSNITRIDLSEVSKITVPNRTVIEFGDKRPFIEIQITYKGPRQTKENFVIEKNRRICCDRVNEAGPLEKELDFEAIVSITIGEYTMAGLAQKDKSKDTHEQKKDKEESKTLSEKQIASEKSPQKNDSSEKKTK